MNRIVFFKPQENDPLFSSIPAKLYPEQRLALQKTGDHIHSAYAIRGIAVCRGAETAGRLVLYSGPDAKTLLIGNYECVEQDEAAAALLGAARQYAKEHAFEMLIGPMNGTSWENYRFCTDGGGSFFTEMTHQPYYLQQWKANGFTPLANYASAIDRALADENPAIQEKENEFRAAGIIFRPINTDHYESELEKLFVFCEKAFRKNFLYSPTGRDSFFAKYQAIKNRVVPEAVTLVEYRDEIAGFCFCLPDYLCANEKRLIVKTIARDPEPAFRGLGAVLGLMATRYAKTAGYCAIIHALMHIENHSVDLSERFSGNIFRRYEILSSTV